jgi:acyl transferase domain-containing protein
MDIAVTGMAGRFPGASSIDELWPALVEGRVLTTRLDRAALAMEPGLAGRVPAGLLDDPDYVPVRGHLTDADRFDAALFRISARDAELMDPQHRLMLETAWAALEDAAVDPLGGEGPATGVTGVYASDSGSGYLRAMLAHGPLDPQTLDQAIHGTEPDFIASLISYKLDLTGPAIGVRTACSSSLVGLHLAIQALLTGDCDQAVVVAAGIDFPQAGHLHVPGGIQSASGCCRPFSDDADGVVAGSGVAAVVLRRLADAAGGPPPHGVILGSAINNDGAAKVGYYAPSITGQEAVIRAAVAAAGVEASSIGYLETHGTGTRVGDPIEWAAASAAYGALGAAPGQLAIGALKANTGHLDAAAGLAALIKALLVVREAVVPPVAGFAGLNPLLETGGSPLRVPTKAQPWCGPLPRRAAVSSFGIGGTNAHVVIEQAPARPVAPATETARLVLLSAADRPALARNADRLAGHLESAELELADVSTTLATGRAELAERLAVSGRTAADVARRLRGGAGVARGTRPMQGPAPLVFLFPGQGAQHPGMGLPLGAALPGFTGALEDCLARFEPALAGRVRDAVLDPDFPTAELSATELAQPALFAVEYAAVTALRGLGLAPVALLGHSLGEISAACAAGVLELADAARLVATRGRAMQACPPGAMVALGCDQASATDLVAAFAADTGAGGDAGAEAGRAGLEVAAVNSAASCVLAGRVETVHAFHAWLGDRVFSKVLRTSHAFHSVLIEPALPALAAALAGVALHPPAVTFVSNTTGQPIEAGAPVVPELFVEQARRPVRFADALAAVARRLPNALLVEVGPRRALCALAEATGLAAVALCPARTARPEEEVLAALGSLWAGGQPVDTAVLCGGGRPVHLPTYPFAGPAWLAPEVAVPPPAPRPVPAHAVAGPPPSSGPDRAMGAGVVAAVPDGPGPGPAPDAPDAPDTPDTAALLAGLWVEVLGSAEHGPESDFFALGGDSMAVVTLARRIQQELGVRVRLRDLLAGRTLGRQTELVSELLVVDKLLPEPVTGLPRIAEPV